MRLRFTIRDLLWLAALAAVCVAWWVDHRALTNRLVPISDLQSLIKNQAWQIQTNEDEIGRLKRENYAYHAVYGPTPHGKTYPPKLFPELRPQ